MVEEEKKEINTEDKKEVKYKVTNAVPQDPTLPREINLATIKAFNKKKLKGMDDYEYAFAYSAYIQLKRECEKTFIKQFFLPTKRDKKYIITEFNFISKKEIHHPETYKLKRKIKNRLKYLFIDIDEENAKTKNDNEMSK